MAGLLSKEEEKLFGKKADNLVNWKKFGGKGLVKIGFRILESKDDKVFTLLIQYIDDNFSEKIPSNLKPAARNVLLSLINEDIELFEKNSAALLNLLVDIPNVSEDTEAIMALAIIRGIVESIGVKLKSH